MGDSIIGQILLDQFRVDAFIGAGGMGAVYRVWDMQRNVPLAMKVLHDELAEDQSAFRRFQREANALKSLAHPNIVQFFGLYRTQDFAFLLERFIDGESLKDLLLLRKGKPFLISEAMVYLKALCAALGYAHNSGVVHCDVKPGNVLVDRDGSVYLTDFGIARYTDSTVTTYATAGAPAYMSPEQIRGQTVTPASDVYSLGIMLFEMLAGQRPFRGNEPDLAGGNIAERIRSAHLTLPPPNLHGLNPNSPEVLNQVVFRALEKEPERRYPNAPAFFTATCAALGISKDNIADRVQLDTSRGDQGAQSIPLPVSSAEPWLQPETYAVLPAEDPLPASSEGAKARNKRAILWVLGVVALLLLFLAVFAFNRSPQPSAGVDASSAAALAVASTTVIPTPTVRITSTNTPTLIPTPTSTSMPTPTPTLVAVFDWRTEVLQKAQTVGYFSNLAVDGEGLMHAIYFQDEDDLVWYAYEDNNAWKFENVIGGLGRGFHLSLALDEKGQPHIAYHNSRYKKNDHRVWYIFWNGKEWNTRSIRGSDAWDSQDVSLALGPDGSAHFAYLDSYSKQLQYARHLSGSWDVQSVEPANPDCSSFPIAVDAQGSPHILYQSPEGALYYAALINNSWIREVVDPDAGSGFYSDLALDGQGVPHIAYYDSVTRTLKYAARIGDSWSITPVDGSGDVGQYPSIKVADDGSIHISYYDAGQSALKYAYGKNGQWNTTVVDNSGEVGEWTSLALAQDSSPRITYLDAAQGDLKLAISFLRP